MHKHRSEIINHYIKKYDLKSYLEIGTRKRSDNFDIINAQDKLCIDPNPEAKDDLVLTSDEFFKINNKKFDIVFIDGLHEAHQVYKDILNSIKNLNPNGIILCHDINPHEITNGYDFEEYENAGVWNGDCWKGFVKYRFQSDYECFCIPEVQADIGIIDTNIKSTLDKKIQINIGELTYKVLEENRNLFLNFKDINII